MARIFLFIFYFEQQEPIFNVIANLDIYRNMGYNFKTRLLAITLTTLFLNSCDTEIVILPELSTSAVSFVSLVSARGGGEILSLGNSIIEEKGVCWSLNPNPTIDDIIAISEDETDQFEVEIKWLIASTTYYVRSYAKTPSGTAYGPEVSFITTSCSSEPGQGSTDSECEAFILSVNSGTACCLSGPTRVTPGETVVYKIHTTIIDPLEVTWVIASGSMTIISGQGTSTISVKIEDDFTSGCFFMQAVGMDALGPTRTCGLPWTIGLN